MRNTTHVRSPPVILEVWQDLRSLQALQSGREHSSEQQESNPPSKLLVLDGKMMYLWYLCPSAHICDVVLTHVGKKGNTIMFAAGCGYAGETWMANSPSGLARMAVDMQAQVPRRILRGECVSRCPWPVITKGNLQSCTVILGKLTCSNEPASRPLSFIPAMVHPHLLRCESFMDPAVQRSIAQDCSVCPHPSVLCQQGYA